MLHAAIAFYAARHLASRERKDPDQTTVARTAKHMTPVVLHHSSQPEKETTHG